MSFSSIIILITLYTTTCYSQVIQIISWNIQDLGKTKDNLEVLFIANILRDADLVAIQEVVAVDPAGGQAVARIADELNRMGFKWDYRISDPTNSPIKGQSERYAFLWKTSKLDMIYKPYLDSILDNVCIREPFIGRFRLRTNKEQFILVNFHSRRFDQHPEEEVKYFYDYPKRFEFPVIIAGDFNMSEKEAVFDGLYKLGYIPSVNDQKSTLKHSIENGNYLNHAIDNIYLPPKTHLIEGKTIDFVKSFTTLEEARMISDHLPVQSKISF